MAIGFVAAGASAAGTTSLTVAWPGSQSAGDIGLLLIETSNGATVVASGWTELSSSPVEASSSSHALHVLYKIAAGSDSDVAVSGLLNHAIARILVFSGVDGTTPINSTAQQAWAVGTEITLPSVTTDAADCAIVHVAGTGRDTNSTTTFSAWANANLASITEVADDVTSTAGGGGFGAAWGILAAAGTSGTGTCTQEASIVWTAITVALKPASSGAIAGVSSITLSAATSASAGALSLSGSLAKTLDSIGIASTAALAVNGTLAGTLGSATLTASGEQAVTGSGTLNRTLDDANLVGLGKLALAGAIGTTLAPATVSAAGVLVVPGGGSLSATLAGATVAATGNLAIGATASVVLGALTTNGTGQIRISGTLASTLANVTLASAGGVPSVVTLTDADLAAIAEAVWTRFSAEFLPVDTKRMNGATVTGTGTTGDKWRGV